MAFYEYQGTLSADAPSYVEREADRALLAALKAGEFCYVLTARQMGKSSLMAHTAARLREEGHRVATLDLTAMGTDLNAEQWYDSLVIHLGQQLRLEDPLEDFWLDQDRMGPAQRFFTALRDVVLPSLARETGPEALLIIFIDEIDTVGSLPFVTDEFFAAIRECYNARVTDPAYRRLAFCLLGVATPVQLMRDSSLTPFNLGREIALADLEPEEAVGLVAGLNRPDEVARSILDRILYWTHGHPYLTQRLCQALAEHPDLADAAAVDSFCHELFLHPRQRDQEPNLSFVRSHLLAAGPHRSAVLQLYERIRGGEGVPEDDSVPAVNILRLSGLVRSRRNLLVVRNRIYGAVFDDGWLQAELPTAQAPQAPTLAILPFVDLSADPSAYLSDGLTDELIRVLGHVPGFKVVSRDSVFQLKDRPHTHREIGMRLGADWVLEGSVRRLGIRLRVTAELVATATGERLWSGSFRHGIEEWRMAQERVARAVTEQLQLRLGGPAAGTTVLRQKTLNPEAYNLYLKGVYQANQRTEGSLRRSLALHQGALMLDPDYPPALAGLAETYLLLGVYNYWQPLLAYPKAKEAAVRAVQLDDMLATAHNALACANAVFDRDRTRAEHSFRRALQLNPNHVLSHQWFAVMCLSPAGRHEEALDHLQVAQGLDPLSISVPASLGLVLHLAGRHDEAVEQCRATVELDENFWLPHFFLGLALGQKGDAAGATEAFESAIVLSQGDPSAQAALAYLHARQDPREEAQGWLDRLIALSKSRYVPAAEIALVEGVLGDPRGAAAWLEKAIEEHSFRLVYAGVDPRFATLWADAGCAALLRQATGLAAPVRTDGS